MLMLRQIKARAIALAVAVQNHGADVVPQVPEHVAQPANHLFGHRVVLFGTVQRDDTDASVVFDLKMVVVFRHIPDVGKIGQIHLFPHSGVQVTSAIRWHRRTIPTPATPDERCDKHDTMIFVT